MSDKDDMDSTDEFANHRARVTRDVKVLIFGVIVVLIWLGVAVAFEYFSLHRATIGTLIFAVALNVMTVRMTWANSYYKDYLEVAEENQSIAEVPVKMRLIVRDLDHTKYLYRQASLFILGALAIARVAAGEPILGLFIKLGECQWGGT